MENIFHICMSRQGNFCPENVCVDTIANNNASDQTQPHYCEYEEILTPPSNFYQQNHNHIVDEKYKLYHEEK